MNDYIRLPRSALSEDMWRSGNLARLYIYLLSAIDNNGVVEVSLRQIAKDTRLTLREVRTCLDKLIATQKTTQKTTQRTTQIIFCDTDSCNRRATQRTTQTATQKTTQPKAPKTTSEVLFAEPLHESFVDPLFRDAWLDWTEYRRQHNRPYKNEREAKKGYEHLLKLSHNDPSQAADIVNQTIANGWQGLFPDKSNGTKSAIGTSVRSQADRYSELERAADAILLNAPYFDPTAND